MIVEAFLLLHVIAACTREAWRFTGRLLILFTIASHRTWLSGGASLEAAKLQLQLFFEAKIVLLWKVTL